MRYVLLLVLVLGFAGCRDSGTDAVEQQMIKAPEIAPDYYLAWWARCFALAKSGDMEGAVQAAEKARQLNPDYWPPFWQNEGAAAEE